MRIRFFRPTDEAETGRFLALERRIDAFWSAVTSELGPRFAKDPLHVAPLLRREATRVHDALLVELQPGARPPCIVVSGTSQAGARTVADAVVERAPDLGAISVLRHRAPRSAADVFDEVRAVFGLDLSRARVRAGVSRGHLVEVVVYSHEFSDGADDRALDAANLAVMGLLGEERFDDWIGAVDVSPAARPGRLTVVGDAAGEGRFPLADLPVAVGRVVEGVDATLGRVPRHRYCERAEWTMLDLEPEAAPDFQAQDDLVHVVTMLPEMTKSFLSGAQFASRRFSTVGERFAYLKLDVEDLSVSDRHELRLELEDALNYALVPGQLGCVVAAGLGLRYLYVTLALSELDSAVDLALRVAARSFPGERGWMLFCDTAWAREWIGLTGATPPPFGVTS